MALSSSQTLDVASCVGPLTAAPNCDFYGSKLTACNSLRGSAAASCYCPQTVFDAVVRYVKTQEMLEFEKQFFLTFWCRCEGEFRVCYAGDYFDPDFEAPSSGLFALWHSACDETITYTVTTPAGAEPSITIDPDYCNSVINDCNRFGASTDSCTRSYTAEPDILSCWCQSSILSLASRCQIDGSSSCLLEVITTSSYWSYQHCRNGASAGGQPVTTIPTATAVSRTTTLVSGQGRSTTSATAAPSSLPSVPILSTSSSRLPSLSAASVKPSLWQVVAAAACSLALLI